MTVLQSPDRREADTLKSWTVLCFFVLAIAAAVLQDAPLVIWAMANNLPVQAHKYIGFDAIIQFYPWKVFKYLFFGLAIAACVPWTSIGRSGGQAFKKIHGALLIVAVAPSIFTVISMQEIPLLAFGLKAWLPVLALMIGLKLDEKGLSVLERVMNWLLLATTTVAVLQILDASYFQSILRHNASSFGSGGQRATGTFAEPNTLGGFALARLALMVVTRKLHITSIVLCLVVLVASGSRTTFVAMLVLLPWLNRCAPPVPKADYRKVIISGLFLLILFYGIYLLYLRGFLSLWERLQLFSQHLGNFSQTLFGSGFGVGTISSQTMGHISISSLIPIYITDSLYAGLLSQGGLWLLFGFLLWLVQLVKTTQPGEDARWGLFAMFTAYGTGTNAIEVWPFNVITFMLLGYCLKPDHSSRYNARLN